LPKERKKEKEFRVLEKWQGDLSLIPGMDRVRVFFLYLLLCRLRIPKMLAAIQLRIISSPDSHLKT
jgi:hypothetical protein